MIKMPPDLRRFFFSHHGIFCKTTLFGIRF